MAERQLIVRVIGDDRSLQQAMARDTKAVNAFGTQSQSGLKKFDNAFSKTQKIAAGGFLGGAALTTGVATVQRLSGAASDLNEQVTRSQQVFGATADEIKAFSETTAASLGVSQKQALEFAGTFGLLFQNVGLGSQQGTEFSKVLVKLAADMASFNNTSIEDALTAIRSGLTGEIEPLRRYGVFLSEARTRTAALAETHKTSATQLTVGEKVLARYQLLLKDTSLTQGDFARTSGGLANQQRILAAQVADLEANLGRLLLPAVTKITAALSDATLVAATLADGLQALGDVKIPEIEIPFVMTIGGGKVGGVIGDAVDVLKFTPLNPLFGATIAAEIIRQFSGQTDGDGALTTQMANAFALSVNTLTTNALNQAAGNVEPPKKVKGFGTGLTPKDLFGPLIKDIPAGLQEALLDAQRGGDQRKIIDVLQQAQSVLENALDDPRLKRKGRIEIKKKLASVISQREGVEAEIAGAIKDASDKRQQALEEAARKQKAASAKAKETARKLAEDRRKAAEEAARILQERQFRKLGLDITGEQITPGRANLRKQFAQLGEVEGLGKQVGSKLAKQFELVGKLLRDPTEKLTKDTRAWIRDFFKTVRGELDSESRKPLMPRHVQISEDILTALGLGKDPDFARIRGAIPKMPTGRLAPPTASTATAAGGVNINGDITVVADNPDAFLRELQKKAGRTAGTSRGRFPGRSLGLG